MTDQQKILIKIEADSNKAIAEINSLNKQVSKLSKTTNKSAKDVNNLSKGFNKLGGNLKGIVAGFAGFSVVKDAVGTMMDFETSMKKLGAVSGETGAKLQELEDFARKMGETTKYSATEASEGLNFLAMAGFSANEAMQALPATLDLATIGQTSLASASDIVSDSLTAFGLDAKETERLVDVMATTITSSNTNVEMLGASFKNVAPVASALNVSIEETSASLGVLADSGIKAEKAGTTLKIVLNRLSAPAKAGADALKAMGVNAYDADGKFKGLSKVLQEMKPKLDGMDESSRNNAIKDIFGSEAMAGAITLINNIETVTDRTKKLGEASGSSSMIAKEMNDTLANAVKEVQSAYEGLILKVGDELIPIMKQLAKDTSEWVRTIKPENIQAFTDSLKLLFDAMVGIKDTMVFLNDIAMPDWLGGEGSTILGTVGEGWAKIGQNIKLLTEDTNSYIDVLNLQAEAMGKVYLENENAIASGEATTADILARKEATKGMIQALQEELTALEMKKLAQEDARVSTEGTVEGITVLKEQIAILLDQYKLLNDEDVKAVANKNDLKDGIDKEIEARKTLEEQKATDAENDKKRAEEEKNATEEKKKQFEELKASQLSYWQSQLTNTQVVLGEISAREKALTTQIKAENAERINASQARVKSETSIAQSIMKLYSDEIITITQQSELKDEIYRLQRLAKKAQEDGEYEDSAKFYEASKQLIEGYGTKKTALFHKEQSLSKEAYDMLQHQRKLENSLNDERIIASEKNQQNTKKELDSLEKQKQKTKEVETRIKGLIKMISSSKNEFKIDTLNAMDKVKSLQEEVDKPMENTVNVDTSGATTKINTLQSKARQPTNSTHTVIINASNAFSVIAKLRQPTSSVHTVYVRTVGGRASGGEVQMLASGGMPFARRRGKIAGHDLTGRDDIPTMLTRGEFIQQVRAVDYYGKSFMEALNRRLIPKEVFGMASGGSVGSVGSQRAINLNIDQKTFQLMGDDEVAGALEKYLRKNL